MLCSSCKKNQATKTYERVKNGKRELEYYCLQCYHNTCLSTQTSETQQVCPYCGVTATEIKKRNVVGCAFCYTSLSHVLSGMIETMQGKVVHVGKTESASKTETAKKRITELNVLKQKALTEGDTVAAVCYEEQIARLRRGMEEEYVWDNRLLSKQS